MRQAPAALHTVRGLDQIRTADPSAITSSHELHGLIDRMNEDRIQPLILLYNSSLFFMLTHPSVVIPTPFQKLHREASFGAQVNQKSQILPYTPYS